MASTLRSEAWKRHRNCLPAALAVILLAASAVLAEPNAPTMSAGQATKAEKPGDNAAGESGKSAEENAAIVRHAAEKGEIVYMLTDLDELQKLLGKAQSRKTENDGGMQLLFVKWKGIEAMFARMREEGLLPSSRPYTIYDLKAGKKAVDIGKERPMVLRDKRDLAKLDGFWGFAGVSLAKLDLTGQGELVRKMTFDSRTVWPPEDKMPAGFEPERLLEESKNPGLGIRKLQAEGIDGRGVAIAIIDQPLLREHVEYAEALAKYTAVGEAENDELAMHAPPVSSVAVGKSCGVAPGAKLYFWATRPMAMTDNKDYCAIIEEILKMNSAGELKEKIRVVSISTGMFAQQKNYDLWKATVAKANKAGVIITTCSPEWLRYGMLDLVPGKDADEAASYTAGRYRPRKPELLVPGGNRTTASHFGPEVYTRWANGGMSWGAAYLAGLAARAYQVNPDISPEKIALLWRQTATATDAGPVVNPRGFIDAVKAAASAK